MCIRGQHAQHNAVDCWRRPCVCLPPRPKGHPPAACLLPLGAQVNDEGGQVIHTVPLVGLVDQRLRRALGTPGCILWHVGAERIRGNQRHEWRRWLRRRGRGGEGGRGQGRLIRRMLSCGIMCTCAGKTPSPRAPFPLHFKSYRLVPPPPPPPPLHTNTFTHPTTASASSHTHTLQPHTRHQHTLHTQHTHQHTLQHTHTNAPSRRPRRRHWT